MSGSSSSAPLFGGSPLTVYWIGPNMRESEAMSALPAGATYNGSPVQHMRYRPADRMEWPYAVMILREDVQPGNDPLGPELPRWLQPVLARHPLIVMGKTAHDEEKRDSNWRFALTTDDIGKTISGTEYSIPNGSDVRIAIDTYMQLTFERAKALLLAHTLKQVSYCARTSKKDGGVDQVLGKQPHIAYTRICILLTDGVEGIKVEGRGPTVTTRSAPDALEVRIYKDDADGLRSAKAAPGIRLVVPASPSADVTDELIQEVAGHGEAGMQAVARSTVNDNAELLAFLKHIVKRLEYQGRLADPGRTTIDALNDRVEKLLAEVHVE